MSRPRKVGRGSPPFNFDPRGMIGRPDGHGIRPPPDYDESPYNPGPTPFEPPQSTPPSNFVEGPHQAFRDHQRLPSAYRASLREPYPMGIAGPAPYKILCIANINQKVSDGPIKEALTSDFSRFGDISVSISHDSGERLAYIYFRSHEEAREAKHAKARTLLFDRPIDIEPVYEPRGSPSDSPPPQQPPPLPLSAPNQPMYSRRKSITPPDYYGSMGVCPPQPIGQPLSRRAPPLPPPHHRVLSPPPQPNYSHGSRYPPEQMPPAIHPAPMPYGRYYMPPSHLPPTHPYPMSSPQDPPYRSYNHHPQPPPQPPHHSSQYSPYHHYGPPPPPARDRDRERVINEVHVARNPRLEAYYLAMDQRGGYMQPSLPPPNHHPSSRASSSLHSSSSHHHHSGMSPSIHHQSMGRRVSSPPPIPIAPHPEHPPRGYMSREYRREKFGSENYGNEPEDGRPSRVLFITNIYSSKTESNLKELFEPFGVIEEIELRKISNDISSALIKFSSMDAAYRAKTANNGKYIGSTKCRITYGKVSASRRLWIGGLGPTTTMDRLEDEFGKFGVIVNMDYTAGRPYAYIEYETANQAQFATHHLKGTLSAGSEKRIRIEFVDPVERNEKSAKIESSLQQNLEPGSRARSTNEPWANNQRDEAGPQTNSLKRSITPTNTETLSTNKRFAHETSLSTFTRASSNQSKEVETLATNDNDKQDDDKNELNNNSHREQFDDSNDARCLDDGNLITEHQEASASDLIQSKSIRDIVDCCPVSWLGQLVLRNFNFPSRIFMCSGRKTIIEKYITKLNGENGNNCPVLRITQRWRLHPQPKLEEVKRRMEKGNLGMLIITSRAEQSPDLSSPSCKTPQSSTSQQAVQANVTPETATIKQQNGDKETDDEKAAASTSDIRESSSTQSRPLKNLISYLEQKDAAGVISLSASNCGEQRQGTDGGPKLLYTFPPCEFALNLLKLKAPSLTNETIKEEFLLGIIVGSSETKI